MHVLSKGTISPDGNMGTMLLGLLCFTKESGDSDFIWNLLIKDSPNEMRREGGVIFRLQLPLLHVVDFSLSLHVLFPRLEVILLLTNIMSYFRAHFKWHRFSRSSYFLLQQLFPHRYNYSFFTVIQILCLNTFEMRHCFCQLVYPPYFATL